MHLPRIEIWASTGSQFDRELPPQMSASGWHVVLGDNEGPQRTRPPPSAV